MRRNSPETSAAPKRIRQRGSAAGLPRDCVVWALVPSLSTSDDHLEYFVDYNQSQGELARAFATLGIPWHWVPVTVETAHDTIARIVAESAGQTPVVLNLCDGDQSNGVPGVDVIDLLEAHDLPYTGADRAFYEITTSKIPMKQAFDRNGVPTARWNVVRPKRTNWKSMFEASSRPLIVKPAISAGSMGLSVDSVVHTPEELSRQVRRLFAGYRGWDLTGGGVFVEEYIAGREYTTFIVGDATSPINCTVYPPIERVFHTQLPATEQFLSFDRLWEFYDREAPLPAGDSLWQYDRAPADRADDIARVSLDAYCAVGGAGYGRVDLREDAVTGELFVLEVNAQCGLSEDENFTSIGAILRFAGVPYHQLMRDLLADALRRHQQPSEQDTLDHQRIA